LYSAPERVTLDVILSPHYFFVSIATSEAFFKAIAFTAMLVFNGEILVVGLRNMSVNALTHLYRIASEAVLQFLIDRSQQLVEVL
jgi:hypothetical protein